MRLPVDKGKDTFFKVVVKITASRFMTTVNIWQAFGISYSTPWLGITENIWPGKELHGFPLIILGFSFWLVYS